MRPPIAGSGGQRNVEDVGGDAPGDQRPVVGGDASEDLVELLATVGPRPLGVGVVGPPKQTSCPGELEVVEPDLVVHEGGVNLAADVMARKLRQVVLADRAL